MSATTKILIHDVVFTTREVAVPTSCPGHPDGSGCGADLTRAGALVEQRLCSSYARAHLEPDHPSENALTGTDTEDDDLDWAATTGVECSACGFKLAENHMTSGQRIDLPAPARVPLLERVFKLEEEGPDGSPESRWRLGSSTLAQLGWSTAAERRSLGVTATVFAIRHLAVGESRVVDRELAGRTRYTRVK